MMLVCFCSIWKLSSDLVCVRPKFLSRRKKQKTHINVDGLDRINVDIWGRGGTIPLAKLVSVVLLTGPKTGWDGNGLGRGYSRLADRPVQW